MKITKLIIPLLGLTTINNNNQANAIQIEKELSLNMPYEILARDNWDNYLATENLMENKVIQLNTQNFFPESGGSLIMPIEHRDGCWIIYTGMVAGCQGLWFISPANYRQCMRVAWDT